MITDTSLPLDALLQFSFEFITILSPDGMIAYQSPACEQYLGYHPAEMIGRSLSDYISTCDCGCDVGEWYAELAPMSAPVVFEAVFRHALDFPVFVECCLYLDSAHPESNLIMHVHDIGELKATRDLLRERDQQIARNDAEIQDLVAQHTSDLEIAKKRVESILDNSSDAIILATSAGRICQTNASFDRLFGYEPDQMFDQPLILTIIPEQWRAFSSTLNDVNEHRQRTRIDVRACRMNGAAFDADIAIAPLPHNDDGIVVSIRDISERKQMENALRENERRFRGLFESSNDAVFILSLDNMILAANTRAVDLLGYPLEEIVGSPATRFTVTDDSDPLDRLEATYQLGSVPIYERRFRRADKQIRDTEINLAVIRDEDGSPLHVQSIVHDITERKRIESELRQSLAREQELGILRSRFVSTVSHEFRTPLATIQATSDALHYYLHKMTQEQIDGRFDKIQSQVKHMVSLLEDVLTFGQVQSETLRIHATAINLDEFCQLIIDDLRGTGFPTSEVLYECSDPLIEIDADKKLLRQVVTNLVTNARKYSPGGTPVHVRLYQTGASAIIEVSDQGIGIPEADQAHLFEAFYRASNTGSISGTGLGLVISKHAIELHHGTITVKSTVGVGTTFTITLPMKTYRGTEK